MWGPYLFELGEIITTKSLSLFSGLYHSSCYYCHNGLQLDAENRLIYFSFITFQRGATLSLRLSICLYGACVCVGWTGRQITLLSLSFIFDSHNFIIGRSLSLSLSFTIPQFFFSCNSECSSFMSLSLSPTPFKKMWHEWGFNCRLPAEEINRQKRCRGDRLWEWENWRMIKTKRQQDRREGLWNYIRRRGDE